MSYSFFEQDPRETFPNIEDYLAIKAACNDDYKHALRRPPTDDELKECAKYFTEWPSVRVLDQWRSGEPKGRPQAALEIALRYLSGCSALKVNPEAALYVLDAFHDPERCTSTSSGCKPHPDPVAHLATQPELVRAHSFAAHAHYQKFTASPASRDIWAEVERHYSRRQTVVEAGGYGAPRHTSLKFALHHASESARLGLVSSIVLRVGFVAREIGEGFGGVDFGRVVGRTKRYRPLWRAVDDRLSELYAEARKAFEATQKDNFVYACCAEGCARTCAKSSAAFKACAGKCPADLKPRYCSKQCQVKDWSRHKTICKPGCTGKIPKIPNKSIVLEWFELGDPDPEPEPELALAGAAAPEAQLSLPAGSVSVDVRPQDDSASGTTEGEVPHQSCVAGTSEDLDLVAHGVHDHASSVPAKHAACGAEDSPKMRDERSSQDPDGTAPSPPGLSTTPVSCLDDVPAQDEGLQVDRTMDDKPAHHDTGAAPKSPEDTAACATSSSNEVQAQDRGEVAMLLVTQHVFSGGDDSQRPWSDRYFSTKRVCFFDHREARSRDDPASQSALEPQRADAKDEDLAGLSSQQLYELWKGGANPAATLEMALRYISGACTVQCRPNPEAALIVLAAFHSLDPDPAHKPPRSSKSESESESECGGAITGTASRLDVARAHALAAQAHFEMFAAHPVQRAGWADDFWRRPPPPQQPAHARVDGEGQPTQTQVQTQAQAQAQESEHITLALHHASESARLGLVSTLGLRLGLAARELGEGCGVDAHGALWRGRGRLAERARRFRPLWGAMDECLGELYEEARGALRRGDDEYVCGAEGCGRRSNATPSHDQKAKASVGPGSVQFKACAGKCPQDLKPRYCSKQCQVKDWPRHKKICKPGYLGKHPKLPDKATVLEWFELEEPEPEPAPAPVAVAETQPKSDDKDDSSEPIADDEKPQEGGDDTENPPAPIIDDGAGVHVRDEHTICGSEDSQDVQDNVSDPDTAADPTQAAPPRLGLTSTSRCLDQCAQADCDSLDRAAPADEERLQQGEGPVQESSEFEFEEAAERGVREVEDDKNRTQEAENPIRSTGWGPQESEDSLSSPDSECAPLTPQELSCPPRPFVFGCVTPEYLREMWEEEGPGAWMESGVWASNPPHVLRHQVSQSSLTILQWS